jgi:hypothetical protein
VKIIIKILTNKYKIYNLIYQEDQILTQMLNLHSMILLEKIGFFLKKIIPKINNFLMIIRPGKILFKKRMGFYIKLLIKNIS